MTTEAWVKARMEVSTQLVTSVEALFEALGAAAVSLEDARDQPLLEPDPGAMPLWARVVVSGLFAADDGLRDRFDAAAETWTRHAGFALPEVAFEPLADADWTHAWRQHAQPLTFGEVLRIVPVADDEHVPDADYAGATVALAPGLAFGTGSHPTTRGCLAGLARQPPGGQSVIDFGCGSGILALAALALGAEQVVAVDHDPQALAASEMNAHRNGVAERLAVHAALPEEARCDLLLANVLAGPLIELAPQLQACVRPGGRVLLSGILAEQVDAVRDAWPEFRFDVQLDEGWACLDGQHQAAAADDASMPDAPDTVHCFACSEVNPVSLGMHLWLDGERCRGTFTPRAEHCGWTGVTHGGLLFTALDEVMANWIWLQQLRGYTARADVRYRQQVPTGTELKLEAWCVERRRRLVKLAATAVRADTGEVVAESEASFMLETASGGA